MCGATKLAAELLIEEPTRCVSDDHQQVWRHLCGPWQMGKVDQDSSSFGLRGICLADRCGIQASGRGRKSRRAASRTSAI
jgi:hypothetical protein